MKSLSTIKKVLICVITISIVLIAGTFIILISRSPFIKTYEKHLSLGEKYLTEMNYERAITAFTRAIEIEPKSVQAYIGLTEAYEGRNDDRNAKRVYKRAYDAIYEEYVTNRSLLEGSVRFLNIYIDYLERHGDIEESVRIREKGYEMTLDDNFLQSYDVARDDGQGNEQDTTREQDTNSR